MKRAYLICLLLVFVVTACADDSGTRKITLAPQPQLGAGIYLSAELASLRDVAWSPKDEELLVGWTGRDPYPPMGECVPSPLACAIAEWLFPAPNFHSEIVIVNLQAAEGHRILRTEVGEKLISTVFWLPDGEHVGYIVQPYNNAAQDVGTWSIRTDGSDDRKISSETEHSPFLNSGRIVSATSQYEVDGWTKRPYIHILDSATGKETEFSGDPYDIFADPQLSPTGKLIAFDHERPSFYTHTIDIRELSTGCKVQLPIEKPVSFSWSADGSRLLVEAREGFYIYIVVLDEFLGPKYAATGSICP